MMLVIATMFAALCLGYAFYGWYALSGMPPGQDYDDARGFVWFWAFLGAVGAVSAYISWRMARSDE